MLYMMIMVFIKLSIFIHLFKLMKQKKVFENQALDKKYNKVLHIAGYTNMINGNKYILYLKLTDDNYYVPLVVTISKVPLTDLKINHGKLKSYNNESNEVIGNLHKQIQKNMKI